MQEVCSVDDVGDVEILSVVSGDEIGIYLLDEISPSVEKISFFFKTINFGSNNLGATFKSEHISDERFRFSMNLDYICNLNDRVFHRSWESTLFSGTLDIKRQNS